MVKISGLVLLLCCIENQPNNARRDGKTSLAHPDLVHALYVQVRMVGSIDQENGVVA